MSEWGTDLPFAPVPMWVLELKISDRAVRLYALLAGMRNYSTNQTSLGRKLLAKKLRCSDDSLDRAKAELESTGAISVLRGVSDTGQLARNVYTIHLIPPANRTDAALPIPAGERARDTRTDAATNERPLNESSSSSTGWLPKSVGGLAVTDQEREWTDALLAEFNTVLGKRFAGKDWRTMIVRRMREHPEMDLAEHVALVKHMTGSPWWKNDPTPAVIWGNGKTFDMGLNRVTSDQDRHNEDRYTKEDDE